MKIWTHSIILAAGQSTRMGRPKALLEVKGESFLRRIVRAHLRAGLPVTVVLGEDAELIRPELESLPAAIRVNPHPERGPLSSIQSALESVSRARAVVVHPVDHPLVVSDTLRLLTTVHGRIPHCILIPRFRGRKGHPVLFPARFFPDLHRAPLEAGARAVVRANRTAVHYVDVEDSGILINVNTLADYARLGRSV